MTKLRYILTIYDRNTKTIKHLERNAETINATITKELGDWTIQNVLAFFALRRRLNNEILNI
jgi:hypothetical protein